MKHLFFLGVLILSGGLFSPALLSEEPVAPHLIVKQLYAEHQSDESPFFQSTKRALVDRYFTKALGDLLWKEAKDSGGEVGKLDFDPLFASQDPQIEDFVIGETGWGGDSKFGSDDKAVVQVTFKDGGAERMVSFRFLLVDGKAWKIDDIRYRDLDDLLLKDLLSAP